jgi:hypothetical protein
VRANESQIGVVENMGEIKVAHPRIAGLCFSVVVALADERSPDR